MFCSILFNRIGETSLAFLVIFADEPGDDETPNPPLLMCRLLLAM